MYFSISQLRHRPRDVQKMCGMSGATNMQGYASGCLSVWISVGYEWKGTFKSIEFIDFIALYTNWGTWGD